MSTAFPKMISFRARATGYYPDASPLEGGFVDRIGNPLHTLQDVIADQSPYVSCAMDSDVFPYGTRLCIPEMDALFKKPIEFRVVDTGQAFEGKGTARIDICCADKAASELDMVNKELLIVALTGCHASQGRLEHDKCEL